jgi:hypothetical protein
MATWTDQPPQSTATEPRPLLARIIEVLFPGREPDPALEVYGPCDRSAEAGQ